MEQQRRIFISYSRTNGSFALKLAKELNCDGFVPWLDQLDIPAGARWDDEVERALRECEIFMLVLTPASVASDHVKDEIGYALLMKKRFIPILLEICDVPFRLQRFQYVDFTKRSFDEGVQAVKEQLMDLFPQTPGPGETNPASTQDQIAQAEAEPIPTLSVEDEVAVQTKAESGRKAKEEAGRLSQKAEKERIAIAEAEAARLATQKVEEERAAKAEAESRAKEEADRLAQKAEEERIAKAEEERLAAQKAEEERVAKAEADRKAQEEAARLAAWKAEEERVAKAKVERKAKEDADRIPELKAEVDRQELGSIIVDPMTDKTDGSKLKKSWLETWWKRGLIAFFIGGTIAVSLFVVEGALYPPSVPSVAILILTPFVWGVFGLVFYPHRISYILSVALGIIFFFFNFYRSFVSQLDNWRRLFPDLFNDPFFSDFFVRYIVPDAISSGFLAGFILAAIISRFLHSIKKI